MAGYIGGKVAVSAPQQIETKHTITATASQTSIPNIGYTVGAVHVYQNGIRLVDGTDYTATNGSTVTLETGATEGDQIVIVSHGSFETSDTVSKASGGTFSSNVTVSGNVTANAAAINANGSGGTTGIHVNKNDTNGYFLQAEFDGGTYNNRTYNLKPPSSDSASEPFIWSTGNSHAWEVDGSEVLRIGSSKAIGLSGANYGTSGQVLTSAGSSAAPTWADAGGGMEFIASSGAMSGAASASFTQFDASKYDHYLFKCMYVTPATDNVHLKAHVSTDGGSSYDTTGGNYHRNGTADDIGFNLNVNYTAGSDSNESGISGTLELFGPHLTTYTTAYIITAVHTINALTVEPGSLAGQKAQMHIVAADVDAIQFKFSSGNIASGEITMFGIVNS